MKPKTKQMILDAVVSKIKLRFDVEPEIRKSTIVINAGNLSIDELKKLQTFCEHRKYEMEIQKSVTFKITVQ